MPVPMVKGTRDGGKIYCWDINERGSVLIPPSRKDPEFRSWIDHPVRLGDHHPEGVANREALGASFIVLSSNRKC